jgi:alpha-ketoglutarate-dependent 2,4-dichlorophenoxyacetate dioxygenase
MAEARIYLRNLIEHAIQPRFVYVHHWQSHGPVMWDNRQTMHHVRRFDETKDSRDIRRTTISSDGRATPQVIQT